MCKILDNDMAFDMNVLLLSFLNGLSELGYPFVICMHHQEMLRLFMKDVCEYLMGFGDPEHCGYNHRSMILIDSNPEFRNFILSFEYIFENGTVICRPIQSGVRVDMDRLKAHLQKVLVGWVMCLDGFGRHLNVTDRECLLLAIEEANACHLQLLFE